ncbi:hypothetical protein ACFTWF_35170 [Rhodococcus sp. NPDC056960]|uniref:hypothetical protein n=1 Tax=Rhodococcus sp. NPDC056960 TaxID=3345982 RepID=UPI003637BE26
MSSGIDQLNQMRSKSTRSNATRTMPPPRHQPRATPVNLSDESPSQEATPGTPVQEPVNLAQPSMSTGAADVHVPPVTTNGGDADQQPPAQRQTPAELPKQAPASVPPQEPEELTKSTIYLDDASDQFLEEAIYLGRKQKPRIDSRSAIVRFALRALSESMTPGEVIDAIRAAAPPPGNQGRPRL